jgi:hypothetical protein
MICRSCRSRPSLLLSRNVKIKMFNFTCCFVWDCDLVALWPLTILASALLTGAKSGIHIIKEASG